MAKRILLFPVLLLLAGLLSSQEKGGEGTCLVLRGGNLVTAPGKVLPGTDLVIRDGIIVKIGKDLPRPWDARVLDCRGLWIYPGLVHIASRAGIPGGGNPNLDPAKTLSTDPGTWKPFLEAGFTTLGLMARGRGMTGRVAVIRPTGRTRAELVRIECAAAAFGAGGDGLTARSSAKFLQEGKKELDRRRKEAEAAARARKKAASRPASMPSGGKKEEKKEGSKGKEKKEDKPAPKPTPRPKPKKGSAAPKPAPPSRGKAPAPAKGKKPAPRKVPPPVLLAAEVMEGKIPAFIEVSGPTGLLYLEKALGDLRFPLLLFADRPSRGEPPLSILASKVKALGASVVVPPTLASLPFERAAASPALDFKRAGVEFLLQPGQGKELRDFRLRLIRLAKYGLTPADVLAAVTTRPARWLGLADRIGTLEEGKNADLVLFSGRILDVKARLLRVLIEGKTVYEYQKK